MREAMMQHIITLVSWLDRHGYTVSDFGPGDYGKLTGHGVNGRIYWPKDKDSMPPMLFADNKEAFDKLTTCPLILQIPCELNRLEEWLKYLATDEAREWSMTFGFYKDQRLPREGPPKETK